MPKVVDHEQRRQMLAEAVWRVTADRGLDLVSLCCRFGASFDGQLRPALLRYQRSMILFASPAHDRPGKLWGFRFIN